MTLDIFINTVLKVLSENDPVKTRCVRANETLFMNKILKQGSYEKITTQERLSGKKRTLESQIVCNKQRKYCTSLLRKEKQNYFENIDT